MVDWQVYKEIGPALGEIATNDTGTHKQTLSHMNT